MCWEMDYKLPGATPARSGAARIGSGDLGQRITIKSGDEVEALANQFNDMAGKLQESYADLENKVEQRTAELCCGVNRAVPSIAHLL